MIDHDDTLMGKQKCPLFLSKEVREKQYSNYTHTHTHTHTHTSVCVKYKYKMITDDAIIS